MYPTRHEAEELLKEAEQLNPGPWGDHSRTVAHCAQCIAAKCGLNSDKAYVVGSENELSIVVKMRIDQLTEEYTSEGKAV